MPTPWDQKKKAEMARMLAEAEAEAISSDARDEDFTFGGDEGGWEAFKAGFGKEATYGFGDEAAAALSGVETTDEERIAANEEMDAVINKNAINAALGFVGGVVPSIAGLAYGTLTKAAAKAAALAATKAAGPAAGLAASKLAAKEVVKTITPKMAIGINAAEGAVSGAGEGEGVEGRIKGAGIGGLIGGLVGSGTQAIPGVTRAVADTISNDRKIQNAASEMAKQDADRLARELAFQESVKVSKFKVAPPNPHLGRDIADIEAELKEVNRQRVKAHGGDKDVLKAITLKRAQLLEAQAIKRPEIATKTEDLAKLEGNKNAAFTEEGFRAAMTDEELEAAADALEAAVAKKKKKGGGGEGEGGAGGNGTSGPRDSGGGGASLAPAIPQKEEVLLGSRYRRSPLTEDDYFDAFKNWKKENPLPEALPRPITKPGPSREWGDYSRRKAEIDEWKRERDVFNYTHPIIDKPEITPPPLTKRERAERAAERAEERLRREQQSVLDEIDADIERNRQDRPDDIEAASRPGPSGRLDFSDIDVDEDGNFIYGNTFGFRNNARRPTADELPTDKEITSANEAAALTLAMKKKNIPLNEARLQIPGREMPTKPSAPDTGTLGSVDDNAMQAGPREFIRRNLKKLPTAIGEHIKGPPTITYLDRQAAIELLEEEHNKLSRSARTADFDSENMRLTEREREAALTKRAELQEKAHSKQREIIRQKRLYPSIDSIREMIIQHKDAIAVIDAVRGQQIRLINRMDTIARSNQHSDAERMAAFEQKQRLEGQLQAYDNSDEVRRTRAAADAYTKQIDQYVEDHPDLKNLWPEGHPRARPELGEVEFVDVSDKALEKEAAKVASQNIIEENRQLNIFTDRLAEDLIKTHGSDLSFEHVREAAAGAREIGMDITPLILQQAIDNIYTRRYAVAQPDVPEVRPSLTDRASVAWDRFTTNRRNRKNRRDEE